MKGSFQIDILTKNTALGVECTLSDEHDFRFRLCELLEKKKKLELKRCTEFAANEQELKQHIKSETPINIIIQGRGVISKKVNAGAGEDDAAVLNKCLPGSAADDFYLQRSQIDEDTTYVSIVRKNSVKHIIDFFAKNKILVVGITLGPFGAEDLFPFLNMESFVEQDIDLGNYRLTVASNKIINLKQAGSESNISYNIQGIDVEGTYIYAFAAAMGFYLQTANKISHPDLSQNEAEYSELKTHHKLIRWVLMGVAFVCIANFAVYKYYRSQFKDYFSQVQINQESLKSFDNMKLQFEEKKDVLDKNGLLQASRISYYSDKIAASLLNNIRLTKLESFPMKKISVEGLEDYIFQNEKIIVSGTCEESIDFNSWERILKKMSWVKSVSIINYMQEKSGELAKFTIEIELKGKK